MHDVENGHLQDWNAAQVLNSGLEKITRKIVIAAYTSTEMNTNDNGRFFKSSRTAVTLVITTTNPGQPIRDGRGHQVPGTGAPTVDGNEGPITHLGFQAAALKTT